MGKTEIGNKPGVGDKKNRRGRLGKTEVGDKTGVGGFKKNRPGRLGYLKVWREGGL